MRDQSGRPRGRILPVRRRVKDEIHLDRIDYFNSSFMIQFLGFVAKTQEKDAAKVTLIFMVTASKNGMAFNRLKTFLELLFV